jgi:hypothetical protein
MIVGGLLVAVRSGGDRVTSERVNALINNELAAGADAHDIEFFFRRHGIDYGYDRYARKYHGIIGNVSPYPFVDEAIEIDANLDSEGRLAGTKVYRTFTLL